eukprot:8840393-Pyramimonas_sp.AAC.1
MSASHNRSSSMSLADESACFAATSNRAHSMRGAWWRSLGRYARRRILTQRRAGNTWASDRTPEAELALLDIEASPYSTVM